MLSYFLVEHENWSEPRRIFEGPNTNADGLHEHGVCQTIGSSDACMWRLPDESLPEIIAIIAHVRYRRNYIYELHPEDYGSRKADDFAKRDPIIRKTLEDFEVAGYRFTSFHLGRFSEEIAEDAEPIPISDRMRAAYIKTWNGHMSPGDWQGYERDLAAYEAYQRGEDIFEIIRKERETREQKRARSPKNDN